MSIPLLYETRNEVRRLFIAGCELAAGDFRLNKLLPQLAKAGESIPVFGRVAEVLEQVLNAGGDRCSEKMLELANIINAVLYTQGQTSADGAPEDLEPAGLKASANIPYRRLQPVIEALTGQGSGRLEIIREAFADGAFGDIRLVYPLIAALDDSYPEIADMASTILESYGPALVKVLKKSLLPDGGKGHGRRIGLISKLAGSREKEFYLEVAGKGSSEARAAAIRALKDVPECEELLLELSHDRKKENREASLFALAHLGSEAAVKRLFDVFNSKDRSSAVYPVKICRARKIALLLVEEGEKLLEAILKSEKGFSLFAKKVEPPAKEEVEGFAVILHCMEGKKEDEVFAFLVKCLSHTKHLHQFKIQAAGYGSQVSFAEIAAENILGIGSGEALSFLDSVRGKYDDVLAPYSFEAALRSRDAEYVFDNYARYVKTGRKSEEGGKILELMGLYIDFEKQYRLVDIFTPVRYIKKIDEDAKDKIRWDLRWLKVLAEVEESGLVCRLASPKAGWCADYMVRSLESLDGQHTNIMKDIIRGLLQVGYPDMMSIVSKAVEKFHKNSNYYSGYFFNDFAKALFFLPKECAKGMEALAIKQDNASAAKLYEVAQYLKNKEQ